MVERLSCFNLLWPIKVSRESRFGVSHLVAWEGNLEICVVSFLNPKVINHSVVKTISNVHPFIISLTVNFTVLHFL